MPSGETDIEELVRTEQVRTLYSQSAPVLLPNIVNAIIVSAALWAQTSHAILVGWVATMAAVVLARSEMRRRFWSKDDRSAADHEVWGMRFTFGSLCAGLLWGFAGGVLMPPQSLALQVLLMFVIGGMGAGAAASIACYLPAYFSFLLASIVPAVIRLWSFGDDEHLAMLAMLTLFGGALTAIARNVNRALTQAFRLRFENSELYILVSRQQAALVHVNEQLMKANEELESRVQSRTAELHASEERLAEIVNESPDGIVVIDETGAITSTNPAAERIGGRPASDILGKHFSAIDVLGPEDLKRAMQTFAGLMSDDEQSSEEFRLLRPNGEAVSVEMKMRVVESPDGKRRIHAVVRDVTERHRLLKLKDAYERRLREAERLESVGMLAGGVAHDFNNILTTILANVDLLERWTAGRPEAQQNLSEIRHGSMQAANLTKQLLAYSRRQVLDVHPADLAQVVSGARAMFERAIGERNRLSFTLPSEPLIVLVDATQMEQALLNLLVNARHAMPDGGTVGLELKRIEIDASPDWPDAEPGSYVRVSVSDTGTGMDEITRGRIFEPFFTTRELGHGTGLGLSSVHGLIRQARGYIRVVSELGRGSRFEILLPHHAQLATGATASDSAAEWSPGTGLVLLVEDQTQVRRSLQRILEDAGYKVLAAEDADQALALARKKDGLIDLLVSDVIMPGLSGIELSRRLLELYPHLAVLLVSGYTGTEVTRITELGENVQFLQKPFDAVRFTAAAHTALQRAQATRRRMRQATLTN